MREFWNKFTDPPTIRGGSGIIWGACLFLGRGRKYVLGGLDEPVLTLIKETVLQYPVAFDGLVGFPNKFK